jgi:hypothetical protein
MVKVDIEALNAATQLRKSVRREGTVDAGPERWQLFLRPGRRQRPYAHHKDGHGGGPSTVDMRSLPS